MKKLFLVLMMVSLLAVPAMAGHHKDINVAWADDFTLQVNPFSIYSGGFFNDRIDKIEGSFNHFVGIAQVNQSAGDANNQGNAVVVAATADRRAVGIAVTDVDVIQANVINFVWAGLANDYIDKIDGSFNAMAGIAQVNQASGFGNNQKNAVGVALCLKTDGAVAVADADLVQISAANLVLSGAFNDHVAKIDCSFNGGIGVAQVNQSPGSLNNQANVVAVSFAGH